MAVRLGDTPAFQTWKLSEEMSEGFDAVNGRLDGVEREIKALRRDLVGIIDERFPLVDREAVA